MRIPAYNDSNISFNSSWYNNFFEKLPNKEIKNSARYNRIGQALSSPHWNRAALGLAAITTQPAIDYFNPKVDRDTATSAAIRTTAKICVCTTVGFIVRGAAFSIMNKYANGSANEGSTLFTPSAILNETNAIIKAQKVKLHKNAMSTITALCVMLFTNFLLDAPLTTALANKWIAKYMSVNNSKGGNDE